MPHDFMPGLAGVPAAKSAISDVDGERGILEYRGIRVEDICAKSSFLETTSLLLSGRLPTQHELVHFIGDITRHRRIKFKIVDLLKCLPEQGHPMDALQAAVAALGMFYPGRNVKDIDNNYWSAVRLIAKLPTIIAAHARIRRGDDAIPPRDDLDFCQNFLYMLSDLVPERIASDTLDACLILHAEHTMNASTFTGLITASTLADPYTVVASSIGALKGPLHGGANEEVVVILQGLCERLFKACGPSPLYDVAVETERVAAELLDGKTIYPNVDFYSGIIYDKLGIEVDCFTPIFAMARVAGWLAHWFEQLRENKLFRPDQIYSGEHNRPYVPIERR